MHQNSEWTPIGIRNTRYASPSLTHLIWNGPVAQDHIIECTSPYFVTNIFFFEDNIATMTEKLLSPKNDFVFRTLFGRQRNKKYLIPLLNSILFENIVDLVFVSPEMERSDPDAKTAILDIRVTTDQKIQIDIEMQVRFYPEYVKRAVFYSSTLYTSQLPKGITYSDLKKTISITFLNDTNRFFPHFHSIYRLYEIQHNPVHELTDLLEFHIIDMLRIEELGIEELIEPLLMWTTFIASHDESMLEKLAEKDPCIKGAYMELQQISKDKKMRMKAEAREKFLMDQAMREGSAKKEGREEGIEIGREEGILQTAKAMLAEGVDIEIVCKATGLKRTELMD